MNRVSTPLTKAHTISVWAFLRLLNHLISKPNLRWERESPRIYPWDESDLSILN